MKLMSCFGNFRKDDRTCEMCEIACNKQYENWATPFKYGKRL